MGFFSWRTNDTGDIVWCVDSGKPPVAVYLVDDQGNRWKETRYAGYGVFGGKDYYELLAEMNGKTTRAEGIRLSQRRNARVKFPNIVRHPAAWTWRNKEPANAENQGFFAIASPSRTARRRAKAKKAAKKSRKVR